MTILETDVLVVGAGPAGSLAAREASKNGVNVLLIDKKAEIGTPKRCAEGIITKTLKEANIEYNPRWIAQKIDAIRLVAPNSNELVLDNNVQKLPDTGYILERKVFDKHMAMDAIRNGTRVMLRTQAKTIARRDDTLIVNAVSMGQPIEIHAKIIIAADGPESHIARQLGLKSNTPMKDMASCVQYEMVGIDKDNPNQIDIFIGSVAPAGYVWIFPKSDDVANVGLGVLKTYVDDTAHDILNNFVKSHKETQNAQAVEMNVGGDPLGGIVKQRYGDNIMVVGDAAGFVDPLTGDGIRGALLSGMYAGSVAANAIKKGDYSKESLNEYYELTENNLNKTYSKFNKIKDFLVTLDDEALNSIIEELSKTNLDEISVKLLLKVILKASPKSIFQIRKMF
ncbi:MAG: NAD(P)/FAD-dependent oxidoreductase [Methanosphaera sp.]|nr:NAD(P)/FAD-dependent oxidoreductase [Methanosphaera sp.]